MKTLFLKKKIKYDGRQLSPLWAYLNHKVSGNSILSWVGPCQIEFSEMIDGEDLVEGSKIQGSEMLHFLIEVFDWNLKGAVSLQRLFASQLKDYLEKKLPHTKWIRKGDDLYCKGAKLSISIASCSAVSCQIHFAVNISNKGTPVKTCALKDFGLKPSKVALDLMQIFSSEFEDIVFASQKVRPLNSY